MMRNVQNLARGLRMLVAAAAVAFAALATAGELVTGDAAVAKFPAELREMGLGTAKWMQLTNGVEYYYGRFTNLLGTKNDLHMIRVSNATFTADSEARNDAVVTIASRFCFNNAAP